MIDIQKTKFDTDNRCLVCPYCDKPMIKNCYCFYNDTEVVLAHNLCMAKVENNKELYPYSTSLNIDINEAL